MKKVVVFTDLDGTLLDASTYSFVAAKDALALVRAHKIPLIITSSKTRKEIEYYREMIGNHDPFISENGGGIFIPLERSELIGPVAETVKERTDGYCLIRLGATYCDLRKGIETLRKRGFDITGFGDMTVEEVSLVTGLPREEAIMAKQREFDEPFLFQGTEQSFKNLLQSIKELGFRFTRGKFFHLLGNSDKGRAVSTLIVVFRKRYGEIYSVALGDSLNDLSMLKIVDVPIIVQKLDGSYDPSVDLPNLVRADAIGPEGWNRGILNLLKDIL